MKLERIILFIAICCSCMGARAQTGDQLAQTYNRADDRGKRHGMWVLSQGERMGEPGFTEFGNYDHGIKMGPWYKLDGNGELQAMETFKNDVRDGEAKYFESGRMVAVGQYRGLNPKRERDTFLVEDPITGAQSLKWVATEKGSVRHGTWKFYDAPTGRLVREEEWQVDELVFHKEFPMSKEDSLYFKKREAGMPHNTKKNYYKPPANRRTSYSN
ncbi:MAG: hypothetical protein K0R82_1161 [Flavipsychrobacter sp.]|nr:hypothetical protein [Flavipsychrobacter sp.]